MTKNICRNACWQIKMRKSDCLLLDLFDLIICYMCSAFVFALCLLLKEETLFVSRLEGAEGRTEKLTILPCTGQWRG